MQIYPAIDLRQGACVRLQQGKFEQQTQYSADPLVMAKEFVRQGAQWLHVVDLDAAKDPAQSQMDLIAALIKATPLKIQVGGGVRSEEQIKKLLDLGAARVIIGSLAAKNNLLVAEYLKKFGSDRIVIALDVQLQQEEFYVALQGWQQTSQYKLFDLLAYYSLNNLQHLLCTDISRDGMLTGPNLSLYEKIIAKFSNLQLQASGGISCLRDLTQLRENSLSGVIVGRALYEKKFTLSEALGQSD